VTPPLRFHLSSLDLFLKVILWGHDVPLPGGMAPAMILSERLPLPNHLAFLDHCLYVVYPETVGDLAPVRDVED
jgi:hypothetical protein